MRRLTADEIVSASRRLRNHGTLDPGYNKHSRDRGASLAALRNETMQKVPLEVARSLSTWLASIDSVANILDTKPNPILQVATI